MAIVPIPGKVYLRDIRNGNVFEFERSLSEMSFVEQVVLEPLLESIEPEAPVDPEPPAPPPPPAKKKANG